MVLKRKARILMAALLVLSGATFTMAPPAEAQSTAYIEGTGLYRAGRYKEALARFQETLKKYPTDGATYYYMGNCYQQLKDIQSAKACYAKAIEHGKSQPPGVNALKALLAIDPAYAKSVVPGYNYKLQMMLPGHGRFGNDMAAVAAQQSGTQNHATTSSSSSSRQTVTSYGGHSTTSSSSGADASLPQEGKFVITDNPYGNNMTYVSAQLNGRVVPHMLFDTGAEMVLFGRNHLQQLNIPLPTGPSTSVVKGVGGNQNAWRMNVDLKVGNIERRNFPITVQESMDAPPLLGQSFYKDYQCQVDKQGGQIRLTRNDVYKQSIASATPYGNINNVPFTRQGNLMVVNVEINGRTVPMCMDTGAGATQFTKEQLQMCNVPIPQDAVIGSSSGIGGTTQTQIFPVSRVKMGPIDKSNFPIQVVGRASMPYPLLGQDFFGDWKYSIDSINNAIKFHSRGSN